MMEPLVRNIHELWFGELDAAGQVQPDKVKSWFSKNPEFDKHIRKHFLEYLDSGYMGAFDRWTFSDAGLVALIILLDQFPRNIFRGEERSFAYDKKALSTSFLLFKDERYLKMPIVHAYFALMPTMHSEFMDVQEMGLVAFTRLLETAPEVHKELLGNAKKYAQAHRDIIARFGRFPHRNSIVHRESTPEELAFLQEPGSSF